MAQRDTCWHLLLWRRRPRAPTTCANKPAYFSELLVRDSVAALVAACPQFWAFEALTDACERPAWVATDPAFFAEVGSCCTPASFDEVGTCCTPAPAYV